MRCDGCKFWKKATDDGCGDWSAAAISFGECQAVRERWVIQDDASAGLEWSGDDDGAYTKARRDALRAARAYVQDGSQYYAELMTGGDFFCALFVAK